MPGVDQRVSRCWDISESNGCTTCRSQGSRPQSVATPATSGRICSERADPSTGTSTRRWSGHPVSSGGPTTRTGPSWRRSRSSVVLPSTAAPSPVRPWAVRQTIAPGRRREGRHDPVGGTDWPGWMQGQHGGDGDVVDAARDALEVLVVGHGRGRGGHADQPEGSPASRATRRATRRAASENSEPSRGTTMADMSGPRSGERRTRSGLASRPASCGHRASSGPGPQEAKVPNRRPVRGVGRPRFHRHREGGPRRAPLRVSADGRGSGRWASPRPSTRCPDGVP